MALLLTLLTLPEEFCMVLSVIVPCVERLRRTVPVPADDERFTEELDAERPTEEEVEVTRLTVEVASERDTLLPEPVAERLMRPPSELRVTMPAPERLTEVLPIPMPEPDRIPCRLPPRAEPAPPPERNSLRAPHL